MAIIDIIKLLNNFQLINLKNENTIKLKPQSLNNSIHQMKQKMIHLHVKKINKNLIIYQKLIDHIISKQKFQLGKNCIIYKSIIFFNLILEYCPCEAFFASQCFKKILLISILVQIRYFYSSGAHRWPFHSRHQLNQAKTRKHHADSIYLLVEKSKKE